MNINELFFFKTFACQKNSCLNPNTCFFYHNEKDKRRFLIDFMNFFQKENTFREEESKSNIFLLKKDFIFYSNQPSLFNNPLLDSSTPIKMTCLNLTEKNYHILNYQETPCIFEKEEFDFECPNKLFCYCSHKNLLKKDYCIFSNSNNNYSSLYAENEKLKRFKSFYRILLNEKKEVNFTEFIEIFKIIVNTPNSLLTNYKKMMDISEERKIDEEIEKKISLINLNSTKHFTLINEFKEYFNSLKILSIPILINQNIKYVSYSNNYNKTEIKSRNVNQPKNRQIQKKQGEFSMISSEKSIDFKRLSDYKTIPLEENNTQLHKKENDHRDYFFFDKNILNTNKHQIQTKLSNRSSYFEKNKIFEKNPCAPRIIPENKSLKQNIYKELQHLPFLQKGANYTKELKTEKNITFLSDTLPKKDEIEKLVISMLNSHDGIVIFGVDPQSNNLTGIQMGRKQRDNFKIYFNGEYNHVLFEHEEALKYKFYELKGDEQFQNEDLCVLVIRIKKISDNKMIFDKRNRTTYVIKEKFLKEFKQKRSKLKIGDVKQLTIQETINFVCRRLMDYYEKKYNLDNEKIKNFQKTN